jgi:hypothetical protein
VIEEVLNEEPPRFRVRWDDGHTTLFSPVGRGGEDRGAEAEGQELTPRANEAAVLLRHGCLERRADVVEPAPDPGCVVAVGKARVRELELQRDRFETAARQIDEKRTPRSLRSRGSTR